MKTALTLLVGTATFISASSASAAPLTTNWEVNDTSSGWLSPVGSTHEYYNNDGRYSNTANQVNTWAGFFDVEPGKAYDVAASYRAQPNYGTVDYSAQFYAADGTTIGSPVVVTVNEKYSPQGVRVNEGVSQGTGTFTNMNTPIFGYLGAPITAPAGAAKMQVTAKSNSSTLTVVDAVAARLATDRIHIIETNGNNKPPTGADALGNVQGTMYTGSSGTAARKGTNNTISTSQDNGVYVTVTFNDLTPGTAYEVYVSWPGGATPNPENRSNALFTISGGLSSVDVTVDQRVGPDDLTELGVQWERLAASYTITGTTLSVTLTNSTGSGYSFLDGVRVVAVPEPTSWLALTGLGALGMLRRRMR